MPQHPQLFLIEFQISQPVPPVRCLVADVAHVPGAHHGAHGFGGADGRKPGHAAAQDEGLRRGIFALAEAEDSLDLN